MNNWISISAPALYANFAAIQAAASATSPGPATEVLAVVKANAYGHGAGVCAPILVAAGARWLGVTCAAEGARVRASLGGAPADIMVMCGFLPEDVSVIAEAGLVPVVWTPEHVDQLAAGTRVHLEVDTGMGRQGVAPGALLDEMLTRIQARGLRLDGFFTHFCSSEEALSAQTQGQERRFGAAVEQLRQSGLRPPYLHAGNSSSVDNPQEPRDWLARLAGTVGARPMVRTGLALYGYTLAIEPEGTGVLALEPVLTWTARVLSTRTLAAGHTVGYNATFTASAPMRVALLPVGYADGLRRELSQQRGWVMFDGQRAPILGRISMNLTVVDVTGLDGVQAGSEGVLLGPGVTAEDHARLAGTIPYEILCGLHPCG